MLYNSKSGNKGVIRVEEKFKIGWLSPTGEFIECDSYNHIKIAQDVAEKLHLPSYDFENERSISADDALFKIGWAHIGVTGSLKKEWFVFWNRKLTPEQVAFLRPYFESEKLNIGPVTKQHWTLEMEK